MKKTISVFLVSLLVLSSVMAGGGQSSSSAAKPGEKTKIQLWHYFTNVAGNNFEAAVKRFNALPNAPITIDSQYLPRNELLKRYALGVVSNDLPEIGMIDNCDAAAYAAMGMWLDITDRVARLPNPNFLPGPLNSGKYKNRQYTIPIRSNAFALWSNDELISGAKVTKLPETWDELLVVCEALKKAYPNVYPLAFCQDKTEGGTNNFLQWLLSTGATWDNLDSPEGIKAFTFIKTLYDNKYISPEVINWTQNDVEKQFATGNAAMMINGCWMIATIRGDNPTMKYTISPTPRDKKFVTTLGGENLGLTKAATGKEDLAWVFIEWILSLEENIPFNQAVETVSPNVDAKNQYPGNPVMQRFEEQVKIGIPRGPHPKWPELSAAVQDAIQENLTGSKPPARAAADAAAKIKIINASLQ